MTEEKRARILIASVLKPVDDTRMFGKIGASLASTFDVHVAGQEITPTPLSNNIVLHPHKRVDRLSIRRIFLPFKTFALAWKIKPDILIITTHELLWMAMFYQLFFKCSVVYDVQENYYINIRHTNAFPKLIRPVIAEYVRLKEWITSPFMKLFLLAEKAYANELPFLKGINFTVIENKVRKPHIIPGRRPPRTKLLFSGTLAETTGVFVAIDIARFLHSIDPSVTLTIIGYASQPTTLREIKRQIEISPYVKLIGGDTIVPHQHIIQAITQADAGFITYVQTPATRSSVPTKLYEYLGYKLPIILIDHQPWVEYCKTYNAAVIIKEENIDALKLYHALQSAAFYSTSPDDVFWESEEKKLFTVFSSLLPR